ncbi:MAG TPA: helix-turn-helix domain-containing protein [Acidimicrobiales bacterium]|jgi:AraC-like DNA-binding protein|nr:helix-turn-helix domain-containing protein [Acidimicrobiales bacterium]
MYRERPSRLPGAFVWSGNSGGETRVLPDGCMDLIYRDGNITIAGPDTRAHVVDGEQWSTAVGLRFAPGCAPRVIGIPAHELADLRVSLDDVWSSRATRHAVERLLGSDDPGAVLEDIALQHDARADDPDALLVDQVSQQARIGDDVTTIAAAVGLSTRQLHRRCRDAFGYGAKTLSRILRMTRALDMARAGTTFAAAAAQAGYADQAHLSREVKDLTDVTLGQLVAPAGNSAYRSTE